MIAEIAMRTVYLYVLQYLFQPSATSLFRKYSVVPEGMLLGCKEMICSK